jgi:hypothetical protein
MNANRISCRFSVLANHNRRAPDAYPSSLARKAHRKLPTPSRPNYVSGASSKSTQALGNFDSASVRDHLRASLSPGEPSTRNASRGTASTARPPGRPGPRFETNQASPLSPATCASRKSETRRRQPAPESSSPNCSCSRANASIAPVSDTTASKVDTTLRLSSS